MPVPMFVLPVRRAQLSEEPGDAHAQIESSLILFSRAGDVRSFIHADVEVDLELPEPEIHAALASHASEIVSEISGTWVNPSEARFFCGFPGGSPPHLRSRVG